MLKNKRIAIFLMVIAIFLMLLMVATKVKAIDTFTTSDGIVIKKKTVGKDGTLEFAISNANFNEEKEYKWGISTTKNKDNIKDWYGLSIGSTAKTADFNLNPSNNKIEEILYSTNTAYLYIKENQSEALVIDGLKLDLTLEANELVSYEDRSNDIYVKSIYGIIPSSYQFVKIEKGDGIPEDGWKSFDNLYANSSRISKDNGIKEDGTYYLWVKYIESGSKIIYGNVKVTIDSNGPTVNSIKVTSPVSGTYKTSQTVKIRVCFNEKITGTSVPTLKIKFGESAERSITNGTISGDYIEYSYNIQDSDKGQLATVSLSGGAIKDEAGNDAKLSCPIISGQTIKANTEGTTTNNTQNQDTKQYISFPMLIVNGKASLSVKNYDGDYKLYYQFIEVNDTQMKKLEELKAKYKKSELSYTEFLNQFKPILPAYNETKWIETSDGKFENDLSKFTGTKKFALWAKLVMKDKTVYEANVYTMNGNGESSNNTSETPNTNNNNGISNKKDDTTAPTKIPQTGENIIMIVICTLIIGMGAFAYIRYNKYRDIK